MSEARRHVIRRECIDLAVEGGESDGFALQGQLAALCQGELATALDQAFARAAPGDAHWRFERIEVDVGHFTPERFARDFVAAVAAAVEEQVRVRKEQAATRPEVAAGEGDVRLSGPQSIHAAWFHFLATGMLPWWCRLPEGRTLEALVSEAWGETSASAGPTGAPPRAALLRTLAAPVARLRLARQFSGVFLGALLEHLAPGALAVLHDVVETVRSQAPAAVPESLPEQAWAAAFACVAEQGAVTPVSLLERWAVSAPSLVTHEMAERVAQSLGAKRAVDSPADPESDIALRGYGGTDGRDPEQHHDTPRAIGVSLPRGAADAAGDFAPTQPLDLHEGVFVDCAGLVLLHPFLPLLFERRGVVVEQQLVQPDRALALLHFLATGQDVAPEHALLLPKLLCGMPPSALAGAPARLSEEDRVEATRLLEAAIEHWGALGDTSPDALRGNFLVRPGKLSARGDDDQLQVERQAWDLLLGSLPWGIGAVRLPWMRRFLWVEWTY